MIKRNKLLLIASLMLSTLAGTGCSSSTSNDNVPANNSGGLVINNLGVIPVFSGTTTSTFITIHNDSDHDIDGITYKGFSNDQQAHKSNEAAQVAAFFRTHLFGTGSGDDNSIVNPKSAAYCSSIKKGQSCSISVVTPILDLAKSQGSGYVTAHWKDGDENKSYTQVVDYQVVSPNDRTAKSGVKLMSGVKFTYHNQKSINACGNVFAYATGSGATYTVDDIMSNSKALAIVQGNIKGRQITSGAIQSIELCYGNNLSVMGNQSALQANAAAAMPNLQIVSKLGGNSYSSSVSNSVTPSNYGAVLTISSGAIIDLYSGNTTQLTVTNVGNAPATNLSFNAGSGLSVASGGNTPCSQGGNLPSGSSGNSCTLIVTANTNNGNATVNVGYNNNSGAATTVPSYITWYNSINGALMGFVASPANLSFNVGASESTTVTITNVGGYEFTGVTQNTTVVSGGTATVTTPQQLSCYDKNGNAVTPINKLPVQGYCNYTVNAAGNSNDQGNIKSLITGTWGSSNDPQTYSRVGIIPYSSIGSPIVNITPVSASMQIVGDDTQESQLVLTVSNTGNVAANVTSLGLTQNPSYLIESSTTCGSLPFTLPAFTGSCTVTLQLGPTPAAVVASGTAIESLAYTGGSITTPLVVSSNINYSVQPNNQNLVLIKVESSSNMGGGNGSTSGSPLTYTGSSATDMGTSLTLTYQNQGTNPIAIDAIVAPLNPIYWQQSGSTCQNFDSSSPLAVNASCTIAYTTMAFNNLPYFINTNLGLTLAQNITLPTFYFTDTEASQQFSQTPIWGATDTIYLTMNIQNINNSVGYSSPNLTITNALTNAYPSGAFTVNSNFESYFTTYTPISGGCSVSSQNPGTAQQSCTLSVTNSTGANQYIINPIIYSGAVVNPMFTQSTTNGVTSFNTTYITVPLN